MNNQLIKSNSGLALSSLSHIDIKAMAALSVREKKIIELALQPKIKEGEPVDIVTQFIAIITTAYTRSGQQADPATLALYADELYNSLLEKYPGVSVAEVKEALKEGVYGEYGEYYGLNPKTFIQFIESFLYSKERKEAKKVFLQKKMLLQNEVIIPPQELEADRRVFINYQYNHFLENKLICDHIPVFIYEYLQDQKLLLLTRQQKKENYERAKSYYIRLANGSKTAASINKLSSSFLLETDKPEITIRVIAMQMSVYDYFTDCQKKYLKYIFPPQIENK